MTTSSTDDEESSAKPPPLRFTYQNWRGQVAERSVRPLRWVFGSTEWHTEPQWLLRAVDLDKGAVREFAFSGILGDVDHVMTASDRRVGIEPFDLDDGMLSRLRALAEQTRGSGRGFLASYAYHAQGSVGVPSAWLADMIDRVTATGEGALPLISEWLSSAEARRTILGRTEVCSTTPSDQARLIIDDIEASLPGLRAKTAAISEVVAAARAFRDSLCLDGWDDKAIAALPDPDALHRLDVALGRLPDVLEEGAALSEVDAATSVEAAATPACACREAQFDVTSPAQEALAIQFCEEIAGRQGERGSPPDPVRLLEMAHALYRAEVEHWDRGCPETSA